MTVIIMPLFFCPLLGSSPLQLSGLAAGLHQVAIIGRTVDGLLMDSKIASFIVPPKSKNRFVDIEMLTCCFLCCQCSFKVIIIINYFLDSLC